MKRTILLMCLLVFASCAHTKNTTTTDTMTSKAPIVKLADISIEGMACQEGCADKIQANLVELEGVSSAMVNFESGSASIEYDPSLVSSVNIQKTITDTKVKDYTYTIKNITITNKE